jgi:hypothetical protein
MRAAAVSEGAVEMSYGQLGDARGAAGTTGRFAGENRDGG